MASRPLRSNSVNSSPTQLSQSKTSASSPNKPITLADLQRALDDSFAKMNKTFNDILEKSLDKLRQEIREDFQAQITNLESKIASQAEDIENLKSAFHCVDKVDSRLDSLAVTSHELMRKAIETNIVVSGIPEDETLDDDSGLIGKVLQTLDCPFSEVSNFARVGRASDHGPRLLKISFRNADLRIRAVKNAKLLRQKSCFNRVFANPDLTFAERREQKRLRDKAREIKSRDPSAKVFVRRQDLTLNGDVIDRAKPHLQLFRHQKEVTSLLFV